MTPSDRFDLRAVVSAEGTVTVELSEGAPPGLAERVKLILRTAFRHADDEGAPPPRRILRWRADR
ncbi:MAG: hypothetical protein FWD17_08000 [Polyangiaceae bacterium]|nr:hypothetical protein [Polyangiaceae bacterium]